MNKKNILSVFSFIYLFILAFIIASYLIPATRLHTINITVEQFVYGLKTNIPIKILASLMFGIIGACIPQVIRKK